MVASPSGALLASLTARSGLEVWRIDDGTLLARLPSTAASLAWLDEHTLRAAGSDALEDWWIPAGRPAEMTVDSGISGLDLSATAPLAATAHGDGGVRVWDLSTGRLQASAELGPSVAKDLAFSLDGRQLVVGSSGEHGPFVLDPGSAEQLQRLDVGTQRRVEVLASGRMVLLGYGRPWVVVDPSQQPALHTHYDLAEAAVESQVAADRTVALVLDRSGLLWTLRDDGRPPASVPVGIDAESAVMVGDRICWSTLLDLMCDPRRPHRLTRWSKRVLDLAASPDGALVAVSFIDGSVEVLDLDGALVARLEGHDARVAQVLFSPDGSQLVTAGWDGRLRVWRVDAMVDPVGVVAENIEWDSVLAGL